MPFIILPSPNPHMSPNAGSFIPRPPLCMCQKGERRNVGEKEVGCLNSLLVCRGRRSTLSSSTSLPRAMGERETETSRLEKGKEGGMGPCKAGWQAQPSFFHFQFRRTWGGGTSSSNRSHSAKPLSLLPPLRTPFLARSCLTVAFFALRAFCKQGASAS